MADQYVNCIFDSTFRVGDLMCVVFRWCSPDFNLEMRLCALITLKTHMNAREMCTFITTLAINKMKIAIPNLVMFAKDSASVNGAAARSLTSTFTYADCMLCLVHTLSHFGEKIHMPLAMEFMGIWIKLIYGTSSAAKVAWRGFVRGRLEGYSSVRWFCTWRIMIQIAEHWHYLGAFIKQLTDEDIAPVLRPKLIEVYEREPLLLKCQFAAMIDLQRIPDFGNQLEGDRLEIMLAHQRLEDILSLGKSLHMIGSMPSVEAVLRNSAALTIGLKIKKLWPGFGYCYGKIIAIDQAESTLYPGKVVTCYTVLYESDNTREDLEEEELRPVIDAGQFPFREAVEAGLSLGFNYLENRLAGTGSCSAVHSCKQAYLICRLVQAFDPVFAFGAVDEAYVAEMAAIVPLHAHNLIEPMIKELPTYMRLAQATNVTAFNNRTSVSDYSNEVLKWWRTNKPWIPAWATAARICFAFQPSSAAAERVFSLVEAMFGKDQSTVLADMIQGSTMLRYNKRVVG